MVCMGTLTPSGERDRSDGFQVGSETPGMIQALLFFFFYPSQTSESFRTKVMTAAQKKHCAGFKGGPGTAGAHLQSCFGFQLTFKAG